MPVNHLKYSGMGGCPIRGTGVPSARPGVTRSRTGRTRGGGDVGHGGGGGSMGLLTRSRCKGIFLGYGYSWYLPGTVLKRLKAV